MSAKPRRFSLGILQPLDDDGTTDHRDSAATNLLIPSRLLRNKSIVQEQESQSPYQDKQTKSGRQSLPSEDAVPRQTYPNGSKRDDSTSAPLHTKIASQHGEDALLESSEVSTTHETTKRLDTFKRFSFDKSAVGLPIEDQPGPLEDTSGQSNDNIGPLGNVNAPLRVDTKSLTRKFGPLEKSALGMDYPATDQPPRSNVISKGSIAHSVTQSEEEEVGPLEQKRKIYGSHSTTGSNIVSPLERRKISFAPDSMPPSPRHGRQSS